MYDLLVLGGGVAGLSAAVRAAQHGKSVIVVTKDVLGASATQYAQGGVAAVLEPDVDTPDAHFDDTITAGVGLCDREAVQVLVREGPDRVRELIALGAEFDREGAGYALTREGGHSAPRILHAGGDATGAEVERALVAGVRETAAEIRERWFALAVLADKSSGRAAGIAALDPSGNAHEIEARHTIIATGGAGQCFAVTTNPTLSTGDGTAMALRAGVAVADVEFMQFHPTALHHPSMPRPLLSEALRGEGAVLRDEEGVAFMADEHPLADLAPRDVVARTSARRLVDRGLEHLWLDATTIPDFERRFPTIWRACTTIGLDPSKDWLPCAPAAHYVSGGVCTDLDGATSMPGLWACGETANSGVHGANRLASNSLLDGLVFGSRIVDAIEHGKDGPDPTGVLLDYPGREFSGFETIREVGDVARESIQQLMTSYAGVLRDRTSLRHALDVLNEMPWPRNPEVANLHRVSTALVQAALAREESRGTHTRLDFPEMSDAFVGRFFFNIDPEKPVFVPLHETVSA
ncbi:MAG: L-aspartate oxidase [Actinobacteria bacterium]|nr:L-aspartate oxidase [Actinomycetota bacterium]